MCGATTLLAHFHFAMKGSVPFRLALSGRLAEFATQASLLANQVTFVSLSLAL
jgi:hypothetical protein